MFKVSLSKSQMLPSYVIPILTICLTGTSLFGNALSITVYINNPPVYPVVSGLQLVLECMSNPSGANTEYEWYKDGSNKVATAKTYGFYPTKESTGLYHCSFRNKASDSFRLNIYFPNTKVSFVNNPSAPAAPVQAGQVKKFKCETDESNPVAKIDWYQYYDGKWQTLQTTPTATERDGSYRGKMRISEWNVTATKAMNGAMVRCKSNYSLKGQDLNPGQTWLPLDTIIYENPVMKVKFPNTKVTITPSPRPSVGVGTTTKFTCKTDESNPVTNMKWYTNTNNPNVWQELTTGVTSSEMNGQYNSKIRISVWTATATKDMNGKRIKCTATYPPNGQISEASFEYYVQWPATQLNMVDKPPASVSPGDTVKVTCQTDSCNPASLTISWYKNGQKITSGVDPSMKQEGSFNGVIYKSILRFQASKQDAQAKYECRVDGQETLKQEIVISVNWPVTELKMVVKPTAPIKAGSTLTIKCETNNANPSTAVTISWYKNGKPISSGVTPRTVPSAGGGVVYESELTFTAKVDDDQTKYECKINDQAAFRKEVTITVHYDPTWNPSYPKNATVASKVKQLVTFTLYVIANPPPTNVTWFFGNSLATTKGFTAIAVSKTTYTLSKGSITNDDYGKYNVEVTNPVGVSTFTFELTPKGPPRPPCCLKVLNVTENSASLSFKSGSSGGASQTFKVEKSSGGSFTQVATGIEDPGQGKVVIVRITGLEPGKTYRFRVVAMNKYGESALGSALKVTAEGGSTDAKSGPPIAIIAGAAGGGVFLLIIIAVIVAVVFILKKKRVDKKAGDEDVSPYAETSAVEMTTGFTNVGHDDATDHARYVETGNGQASGVPTGSEYEEVDRNGPTVVTSTPNETEYAIVEDTSKASKTEPVVCDEYAEVDYNKKTSKKYATPPAPTADGAVYAQVNKKGTQKKPPELDKKKASEKDAIPTPTAVLLYAGVNKPKKPGKPAKPPKHGPENPADYDDVRIEGAGPEYASVRDVDTDNYASVGDDDDELYGEVRDEDGPGAAGLQPEKSFQVGVDGTIYAGVQMAPPTNPDVIRGQDEPETSYASIDFSREAPPLPQDGGSRKPDHPGFVEFI